MEHRLGVLGSGIRRNGNALPGADGWDSSQGLELLSLGVGGGVVASQVVGRVSPFVDAA